MRTGVRTYSHSENICAGGDPHQKPKQSEGNKGKGKGSSAADVSTESKTEEEAADVARARAEATARRYRTFRTNLLMLWIGTNVAFVGYVESTYDMNDCAVLVRHIPHVSSGTNTHP